MSRRDSYDVVVVGGRIAGASTAMLLARSGARVALLDRHGYGTDITSTHALMRAGVLQLARWGVLPDVVAAGTPEVRRTVFSYDGAESVSISIRPTPHVDALYAPRRRVLDQILVDAAAAAGVQVWHQTTVTGLLSAGRRVSGVQATREDGRAVELGARFVVGADGIRSGVAGLARAPVVQQGRTASAVLYRYFDDLQTVGYEWAYGEGAATGLIPTNDGQTCVFVSTTPQQLRALRRDGVDVAFEALLTRVAPDLRDRVQAATPSGRHHGWGGVPGFVRHSYGPGWALVGDAGYFKDPITTHGMTDALRDAELLGGALVEVLERGAQEELALARYQATRDTLSAQLFSTTEAVAAYDWDIPTIQTLLRQVSSAMSDEVDHLQALPDVPPMSSPRPRRGGVPGFGPFVPSRGVAARRIWPIAADTGRVPQ